MTWPRPRSSACWGSGARRAPPGCPRVCPWSWLQGLPRAGVRGQDVIMPWFPDFASAVELVRQQTRAQGQADPIGQYFTALKHGDAHLPEPAWPGPLVVYDPRVGEVSGHRQLRHFVQSNQAWMAEHQARTE